MGYRSTYSDIEYTVLTEREFKNKDFTEIGSMLDVTSSRVSQIYMKALRKKLKAYIDYIANNSGADKDVLINICAEKRVLYGHNKYVISFLEREYAQILTVFRAGDPGSPYLLDKYTSVLNETPTRIEDIDIGYEALKKQYRYYTIKHSWRPKGKESHRIELTELEKQVKAWKENDIMFYSEIADKIKITPEKALKIYEDALRVTIYSYLAYLAKTYGQSFDKMYKQIFVDNYHRKRQLEALYRICAEHDDPNLPTYDGSTILPGIQ